MFANAIMRLQVAVKCLVSSAGFLTFTAATVVIGESIWVIDASRLLVGL